MKLNALPKANKTKNGEIFELLYEDINFFMGKIRTTRFGLQLFPGCQK